jgi:unsaturated rhamnogalacturonyl hydrolase
MMKTSRFLAGALGLVVASSVLTARSLAQSAPAPAAASAPSAASPATRAKIVITPPTPAALADYFGQWPDGADPKDIGQRVAENFVGRQFRYETTPRSGLFIIYPEVIAWYGALTFAQAEKNPELQAKLTQKFAPFMLADGQPHINYYPMPAQGVDNHVFGAVPLELYLLTGFKSYLDFGVGFADRQWDNPGADGLSRDSRYWVDDLYMLPLVEMQAYRATKDKKYLDRVALTFSVYLDRLQQPSGLFYHGDGAPYYWSRGDGWVAAGITELLRDLPPDHPLFAKIYDGYHKMMAALLKNQGDDGLWKQLIDHPEAWSESSGSAMFAFAFVTGVKNGWLDAKTYGPAARKAWLGLVKFIDADGNISNVCVGTNKWTAANGDGVQYYLNRGKDNTPEQLKSSDVLHGNAPVLWTATALLR